MPDKSEKRKVAHNYTVFRDPKEQAQDPNLDSMQVIVAVTKFYVLDVGGNIENADSTLRAMEFAETVGSDHIEMYGRLLKADTVVEFNEVVREVTEFAEEDKP